MTTRELQDGLRRLARSGISVKGLSESGYITAREMARLYDVPLHLISPHYPRPRFFRLRWRLRRFLGTP